MQLGAPLPLKVPAGHVRQEPCPALGWCSPAGQGGHADTPPPLKDPAAHDSHAAPPPYFPTGQLEGVPVGVPVGVGEAVVEGVPVGVGEVVGDGVPVGVPVPDPVPEGVLEREVVVEGVHDGVPVPDPVPVGVLERDAVVEGVRDSEGVVLGDGVTEHCAFIV